MLAMKEAVNHRGSDIRYGLPATVSVVAHRAMRRLSPSRIGPVNGRSASGGPVAATN
jgi:hypothetical protein